MDEPFELFIPEELEDEAFTQEEIQALTAFTQQVNYKIGTAEADDPYATLLSQYNFFKEQLQNGTTKNDKEFKLMVAHSDILLKAIKQIHEANFISEDDYNEKNGFLENEEKFLDMLVEDYKEKKRIAKHGDELGISFIKKPKGGKKRKSKKRKSKKRRRKSMRR
jgi:hypothetical protein